VAKKEAPKKKAKVGLNDDIGEENRLEMYRLQLEVRHVEQRAHDLFFQNLIKGTSHLSIGQEAIAAGFAVAMNPDDYSFGTHRGHAQTLVRGAPISGVLGELMGRECGLMNGKGGSMHLTSVEHGVMGSYAIIGAHLPIALGTAWQAQYNETGQVSVCYFGDGAANIGAFHESLNYAVVEKLPVVFVCENNLYMEYTPIDAVTAVEQCHLVAIAKTHHPAQVMGLWRTGNTLTTSDQRVIDVEANLDASGHRVSLYRRE